MKQKPLKRHKALQPLSREHHYALLLCWKIRRGLEQEVDPLRIGRYVQQMWNHQLAEHFEIEEKLVFPLLDQTDKMVRDAISDHRLLKRLIWDKPFTVKTLNQIEERLERHVRLEERQVFPLVQAVADEVQLLAIESVHDAPVSELQWDDDFWSI